MLLLQTGARFFRKKHPGYFAYGLDARIELKPVSRKSCRASTGARIITMVRRRTYGMGQGACETMTATPKSPTASYVRGSFDTRTPLSRRRDVSAAPCTSRTAYVKQASLIRTTRRDQSRVKSTGSPTLLCWSSQLSILALFLFICPPFYVGGFI